MCPRIASSSSTRINQSRAPSVWILHTSRERTIMRDYSCPRRNCPCTSIPRAFPCLVVKTVAVVTARRAGYVTCATTATHRGSVQPLPEHVHSVVYLGAHCRVPHHPRHRLCLPHSPRRSYLPLSLIHLCRGLLPLHRIRASYRRLPARHVRF